MHASAIAKLINAFNATAVSIAACLAIVGALVIIVKKIRRFKIQRIERLNIAVKALCAAALAAFALEATAFNFWSYLRYFSGEPMGGAFEQSETAPNVVEASDGTKAELVDGGIRFNNLDRMVTSVFVDADFNGAETAEAMLIWTDEALTTRYTKQLHKSLPRENYMLLQSHGKVSEIVLIFDVNGGQSIDIKEIVVNKPIPFYFSGLRIFVVSALLFALFALVNKNLRAMAAYYLFEYRFDPKNKKQNAVYGAMTVLLALYSFGCVYTSLSDADMENPRLSQYNKFLTDALIAGRANLDYGNPEMLLGMQRPYDYTYRLTSGYHEQETNKAIDWAWYKGKYYCYFGVVPAALLYVPYKMATGNYLSNQAGIFLFCAVAVVLLAALWRHCAVRYMPDARYALYLLSLPTLFFASCLFVDMRAPAFASIVKCAGFMFTAAGLLLLLKSVDGEKVNHAKLFFACLCLALVFGCRPNMGLASILVPVVLWKRKTWKTAAFAALPYIIVAIPLCMYNYARFESISEFGANYMLTGLNYVEIGKLNPLGKIYNAFLCSAMCLFAPAKYSLSFPFAEAVTNNNLVGLNRINSGIVFNNQGIFGLAHFPVIFLLFYMFKNAPNKDKPKTFRVLYASLIVGAAIMLLSNVVVSATSSRYLMDFAVFIVIPSLFCAYYLSLNPVDSIIGADGKITRAPLHTNRASMLCLIYGILTVSVIAGLLLSIKPPFFHCDPTLYHYLKCSLGVFENG